MQRRYLTSLSFARFIANSKNYSAYNKRYTPRSLLHLWLRYFVVQTKHLFKQRVSSERVQIWLFEKILPFEAMPHGANAVIIGRFHVTLLRISAGYVKQGNWIR